MGFLDFYFVVNFRALFWMDLYFVESLSLQNHLSAPWPEMSKGILLCGHAICAIRLFLPCPGKAKLGEDHPRTLSCLNNMAFLLRAQGRLAEAEPLYREALEKSPGAQLQRFQWDFGQWIWSHTLLDLRRVIRLLMTGTGTAMLLGYLRVVLACFRQKFPKLLSFQSTSWQIP